MRHQEKIKIQRRRRLKLFWLFAAAAVCALLFEERAAVLYVLSTLATCGVLLVLAFSNFGVEMRRCRPVTIKVAAHDFSLTYQPRASSRIAISGSSHSFDATTKI